MSPDLEADEKVCPYCAEVIKAAAVKCRYCGSDLAVPAPGPAPTAGPDTSASPGAERTEDAGPPATPALAPGPAPSGHDPVVSRSSVGGPILSIGFAVLVVVLAAVLLLVVFVLPGSIREARAGRVAPDGEVTSAATRAVLMDQAGKMTAAALSYDAKTFDKDTAAAGRLMTPSMRKQYLATLAKVRDDVAKQGLVLKAEVKASALVSATDDVARVLEFVNQSTTAKGVTRSQLNQNRVVVTLSRVDGRWLISKMDAF